MTDLLFEIGTEELPPNLIENLTSQIKQNITSALNEKDIEVKESDITTFNSPRRIAILIKNLPEKTEVKEVEIKGPDKKKAFQDDKPTQVAIGFTKKYDLTPADLKIKKVNDIEYVFINTKTGGQETKDILTKILPESIRKTTGDKFMKWGNYEEKFARPIRWIVAILDKEIIKFFYANIESSNFTYGHKFLSKEQIKISSPDEYEKTLEAHNVIACPKKRKEKTIKLVKEEAEKIPGSLSMRDYNKLFDEVTNITECPQTLVCNFDKSFLSLPSIIVETVLVKHQKYFVLYDVKISGKEEILSQFVVVTNGTETVSNSSKKVKAGNEKVVTARLNDAKFFYEEDLKTPFTFEARGKKLEKITLQKGLGTIADKVSRLLKLSEYVLKNLPSSINKSDVDSAIKLLKLDLTTQMVFEMPELQGEIGGIYAKKNNFNELICNAISQQYLNMPKGELGCFTSLLDKLDNIICLFTIGKIPTGSTDPFALRRQAQSIIHIILSESSINIDFTSVFEFYRTSLFPQELRDKFTVEKEKQIKDFLFERYLYSLKDKSGYGYEEDLIKSVCSVGDIFKDLKQTREKIDGFSNYCKQNKESFNPFLTAAKRLVRIVEPNSNGSVDFSILKSEEEKSLLKSIEDLNEIKSSEELVKALTSLTTPINNFFEKVLVNDPDPKIKQARHALLIKGKNLFERICDFNQILDRN